MVQKALNGLTEQHTTFMIAHRLSTIKDADKIIVLGDGDGAIIESGTHEALLSSNGKYAQLWQLQSKDTSRQ